MDITTITALVSILAAASGALLGWTARAREVRRHTREGAAQEAQSDAIMRTDVEYIKRGVDDIKIDMRVQGQRLDAVAERLTRAEEGVKQAQARIDKLERTEIL